MLKIQFFYELIFLSSINSHNSLTCLSERIGEGVEYSEYSNIINTLATHEHLNNQEVSKHRNERIKIQSQTVSSESD